MISVNGEVIKLGKFPDGTLAMTDLPLDIIKTNNPKTMIHVVWKWENHDEQVWLDYFMQWLHSQSEFRNYDTILYMYYCPNARMDRVKARLREGFTLKYFANTINRMRFTRVVLGDVHSPAALALFDNVVHDAFAREIRTVIQMSEPDVIMFPDAGAHARYLTMMIDFMASSIFAEGFPIVLIGEKGRDWKSGKIIEYKIAGGDAPVTGLKVLIIDDICSYGNTFIEAGKMLKERGARQVDLYVSHCETSVTKPGGLFTREDNPITMLYTTNSLVRDKHPQIIEIPIAGLEKL